jgi:hypothetical protein
MLHRANLPLSLGPVGTDGSLLRNTRSCLAEPDTGVQTIAAANHAVKADAPHRTGLLRVYRLEIVARPTAWLPGCVPVRYHVENRLQ